MKRIIQLLFCATFVIGLNAIDEDKANDQQAPTDSQRRFRKSVKIGSLESLFYSIRDKPLEEEMILSLDGEELNQVPTNSVNNGKITLDVELQGTNNFPCIPNIHHFKDAMTHFVDGGVSDERYKQAIYLPAGVQQKVVEVSYEKIFIGTLVALGVCVGADMYRRGGQSSGSSPSGVTNSINN